MSTAFYQTLTRDRCYATLKPTRSISCLLTYFLIQHKINNVQFCSNSSSLQLIIPEVLIEVKIRSILFVCWSCKPYNRNIQPGHVIYWDLVFGLCLMQSTSCCRWQVKTLLMRVLIAVYPLYLSTFLARKAVIPRQALSKRVAFLIEAVNAWVTGVLYILIEIKMSQLFSLQY